MTPVERLVLPLQALNLADALFTLAWIELDLAVEANPLMAQALELHPLSLLATKMGLVSLGLFLLYRLGRHPGSAL